jgi:hypothetical protein
MKAFTPIALALLAIGCGAGGAELEFGTSDGSAGRADDAKIELLIDKVALVRDATRVIRLRGEEGGPFATHSGLQAKSLSEVLILAALTDVSVVHIGDEYFDRTTPFSSDAAKFGSLIYIDDDRTMKELLITTPGKPFDQERTKGGKAFEKVEFLTKSAAYFSGGTVGQFVSTDDAARRYVLWMKMPTGVYAGRASTRKIPLKRETP